MTLKEAAKVIRRGGVVAYPTETFYGLGALPTCKKGVQRIFKVKGREKGKPISLILSSASQLPKWAVKVGPLEKKLIRHFWPGPLTLVLRARNNVLPLLTAGTKTIAVRVPSSARARLLARMVGGALTATSANLSGRPPLRTGRAVEKKLGHRIDGIVSVEKSGSYKYSSIISIYNGKINVIREGAVSRRKIERFLWSL